MGGRGNKPTTEASKTQPSYRSTGNEMKAELAAIRESIGSQHCTTTPGQYGFRNEERAWPRGCADYLREGFGERCTHCFIWRRSGHFSYNCWRSRAKTGHISRETDWDYTLGTGSHPEYAETVPNTCEVWENRKCYRSQRLLFTIPC